MKRKVNLPTKEHINTLRKQGKSLKDIAKLLKLKDHQLSYVLYSQKKAKETVQVPEITQKMPKPVDILVDLVIDRAAQRLLSSLRERV